MCILFNISASSKLGIERRWSSSGKSRPLAKMAAPPSCLQPPWNAESLPFLGPSSPTLHAYSVPEPLSPAEENDLISMEQRLFHLCRAYKAVSPVFLPLLVDVEYTVVQPAISIAATPSNNLQTVSEISVSVVGDAQTTLPSSVLPLLMLLPMPLIQVAYAYFSNPMLRCLLCSHLNHTQQNAILSKYKEKLLK
jgi:hypothetical protein